MLAGEPMYLWKKDSAGVAQLDSSVSHFGARIRAGQLALIAKPPVGAIATHARLIAGANGFAALFAEADASSIGNRKAKLLAYWYGRMLDDGWHGLERLVSPPDGELDVERASPLVRTSEGLVVAIPFGGRRHDRLVVYRRLSSGWRFQVVRVGDVAYITAAVVAGRPHLYVVRPDSTRIPDSNSLSLFSLTSGTWTDRGFLVRGGNRPITAPAVSESAGRYVLSWREDDPGTRAMNARAATVLSDGTLGAVVLLRRGIMDLMPMRSDGDAFRWVVSRLDPNGRPMLELIEWNGGEPLVRDVVIDPFTGPSLAFAAEGEVMIAGPVMSLVPGDEVVATAVLRFVERCRIPVHEAP